MAGMPECYYRVSFSSEEGEYRFLCFYYAGFFQKFSKLSISQNTLGNQQFMRRRKYRAGEKGSRNAHEIFAACFLVLRAYNSTGDQVLYSRIGAGRESDNEKDRDRCSSVKCLVRSVPSVYSVQIEITGVSGFQAETRFSRKSA